MMFSDISPRQVAVTRRSLLESGLSDWQISREVRQGRLAVVGRGRFVAPGAEGDAKWMQDLGALLDRCGSLSVASHRSAARLHGFDGDWGSQLDVIAPLTCGVKVVGVIRTNSVATNHVTVVDGIRCTTVLRTLVDLGRFCSANDVEMAVEGTLRGDPKDPHQWNRELLAELMAFPHRPRIHGHVILREVLARRPVDAIPTASGGETRMVWILRTVGLDLIACRQPRVIVIDELSGVTVIGYPDFLFPFIGLAIEVDGLIAHAGEANRSRDHRRENGLGTGLRILRFTGSQIFSNPTAVANEIASEYRALSARGLRAGVCVEQLGPHQFRYRVA
jgi:hypothetical protein